MNTDRTEIEILFPIGEGLQGEVFKAIRRDRSAGLTQTVAIKILRSETAVASWRHEFESLMRVRSPYCVGVYSFERHLGRPALVMEYVEGITLRALYDTSALTDAEWSELAAQIELGLKDLHALGLSHGDLNPNNVMVDTFGQIRLLDFGLANATGLLATPAFCAPEQLESKMVSPSADLYALGKILKLGGLSDKCEQAYLAPNPIDRRYLHQLSNHQIRKALGEKVKTALQAQNQIRSIETQPLDSPRPAPDESSSWSRAVLRAIATAGFALSVAGATASPGVQQLGFIEVRTERWHRLTLDGHYYGYSPIRIPVSGETRQHQLEWSSAQKHGHKTVEVRPGEVILLRDADFKP